MKKILSFLVFMGCDFNKLIRNIKNFPTFISEYLQFKKQDKGEFKIEFRPMLLEKNSEGGVAKGHYFHQDLLVAQKIYKANPIRHVDIGSRVDGFVAHLATFRQVEVIDIRKIDSNI